MMLLNPYRFAAAVTPDPGGSDQPPAVGEYWAAQGGYYVGLFEPRFFTGAPNDYRRWHLVIADAAHELFGFAWKTSATSTPGTTSEHDGLATLGAVEAAGIAGHPVFQAAKGKSVDGKTDFYIPAYYELGFIRAQLWPLAAFSSGAQVFRSEYYWSATEITASGVSGLQFFSNSGANLYKPDTNLRTCRPVRRVALPAAGSGGAFETAGGFKYWRLNFITNQNGGYSNLTEVEMRATSGGADMTISDPARISASGQFSSYGPVRAFDDNLASSSQWIDNLSATSGWLQYRFDYDVLVAEYTMVSTDSPPNAPKDWQLLASHDGTTWEVIHAVTGEPAWGAFEKRTYAV